MPHPRRYLRAAAEPRSLQDAARGEATGAGVAMGGARLPPSEMVVMNNGVFPAIFSGSGVVGGRAFHDVDNDGRLDSAAAGVPNADGFADVNVWLFSCADDAPIQSLAYARTASNGVYRFTELSPGEYYLIAQPPEGYEFSSRDDAGGGNDLLMDSTVDPETGRTACFELREGEKTMDWSFGLYLSSGLPSLQPSAMSRPPTGRPTPRPTPRPNPSTSRPTPTPTPRPSSPFFVPSMPTPSQPVSSPKPSTAFAPPPSSSEPTSYAPATSSPTATSSPSNRQPGVPWIEGAAGGSTGDSGSDNDGGGSNNNAAVAVASIFSTLAFVALMFAAGLLALRYRRKRQEAQGREGDHADIAVIHVPSPGRGALANSGGTSPLSNQLDVSNPEEMRRDTSEDVVEDAREAIQSSTILARYGYGEESSSPVRSSPALQSSSGRTESRAEMIAAALSVDRDQRSFSRERGRGGNVPRSLVSSRGDSQSRSMQHSPEHRDPPLHSRRPGASLPLTLTYMVTEAELENVRGLENEVESLTVALQAYPKNSKAWLLLNSYLARAKEELDAARRHIAHNHSPRWDPAEGVARVLPREPTETSESASNEDEIAAPLENPPSIEREVDAFPTNAEPSAQNEQHASPSDPAQDIGEYSALLHGEYSILRVKAPTSNLGLVIHREPSGRGLVFVRNFHPLSPLRGHLQLNDEIIAIDDADVQHLSPVELSQVMSQRRRSARMTITVLRRNKLPPEHDLDHSNNSVPLDTADVQRQQQSQDNSSTSNAPQDRESDSGHQQQQNEADSSSPKPPQASLSEFGHRHVSFQGTGVAAVSDATRHSRGEEVPLRESADNSEVEPSEKILFNVKSYISSLLDASESDTEGDAVGRDPNPESESVDDAPSGASEAVHVEQVRQDEQNVDLSVAAARAIQADDGSNNKIDEAVEEEVRSWYADHCRRRRDGIPSQIPLKKTNLMVVEDERGGVSEMSPPPQPVLNEEQGSETVQKGGKPTEEDLSRICSPLTTYEPSPGSDSVSLEESNRMKEEFLASASSLSEVGEMLSERYYLDVQHHTASQNGSDSPIEAEGASMVEPGTQQSIPSPKSVESELLPRTLAMDIKTASPGADAPPHDTKNASLTDVEAPSVVESETQQSFSTSTGDGRGIVPVSGEGDVKASSPRAESEEETASSSKPSALDSDSLVTIDSRELHTIEEEPTTLLKMEEIIQLAKSDRSTMSFADELAKRCSEASSSSHHTNSITDDDETASQLSTSTPKEGEPAKKAAAPKTPSPTRPRSQFDAKIPSSTTTHSNYFIASTLTPNRIADSDFASMLAKRAVEVNTPTTADLESELTAESHSQSSDSSFDSTLRSDNDGATADSASPVKQKMVIQCAQGEEATVREGEELTPNAARRPLPGARPNSEGTLLDDWTEGDYIFKPKLSEGIGAFVGWVQQSTRLEKLDGKGEEKKSDAEGADAKGGAHRPVEATEEKVHPPAAAKRTQDECEMTETPEKAETKKTPKKRITPVQPSEVTRANSFSSDSSGSSGYW